MHSRVVEEPFFAHGLMAEKGSRPGIYSTPESRGDLSASKGPTKRRRRDAPALQPSNRAGAFPLLSSQAELDEAKLDFIDDIHGPSQRHVVKAKMATVEKSLKLWNLELAPPSV